MRNALALALVATVSTACTTTTYRMRGGSEIELRLSGKRTGETLIRTVQYETRHNYYLLGLIPHENPVDLASELKLKPGQALVNARIENSFEGIDALITFGLGLLTAGISPIIWTTRTTTVRGDLVELNKEGAPVPEAAEKADKAKEPVVDDEDEDDEAAVPAALPASWKWLGGAYGQEEARGACSQAGLTLPSRAQLKSLRDSDKSIGKSDVWTNDAQDDDAWSFSFDGGVTFLKDPDEELSVLCVKENAGP